jgi:transcriptional regulator with XRE-family HTH domain
MSAKTPNWIDAAVGRNICIRRMAKGLSQSQLGKRIGSGRLFRIAQILEVPVTALFEGVDGAPAAAASSDLRLIADRRALRLAQGFAAIHETAIRLSIVALVEEAAAAVRHRRKRRKRRTSG